MRLADVTPAVLAEHRDELGKTLAPKTVTRYLVGLSHVFTMAVREWGLVEANPVSRVSKPRLPRGRVRYLSRDERQRLLSTCQTSSNPYLYTVVALALATGARKMELLTLTWPVVDLQRGVITLNDTKNGERRSIPLTGLALRLMRQHARVWRIDTDLVFPSARGRRPADIRRAWEVALQQADIADFRFYDLRHSCASYLAMNGASLAEIADVLGHKSFQMVKQYAHLSPQHTHDVVARMNQAIFGE